MCENILTLTSAEFKIYYQQLIKLWSRWQNSVLLKFSGRETKNEKSFISAVKNFK